MFMMSHEIILKINNFSRLQNNEVGKWKDGENIFIINFVKRQNIKRNESRGWYFKGLLEKPSQSGVKVFLIIWQLAD